MGQERLGAIEAEIKRPKGGGVNFYAVDTDKLAKSGVTQFKAEVGDNFIRIIPPVDPKVFWAKIVYIHRNIGANGATFLCLKKMFNMACPICEMVNKMKEDDPEDERIIALLPKMRYLMFVYDVRDEDSINKGLRWWDVPVSKTCPIVESIKSLSKDRRTQSVIDVSDPVEGRDIEFTRKGTGQLNTAYEAFKLIESDPIPKEWYDGVPAFDDILLVPTYEQVELELYGGSPSGRESQHTETKVETKVETQAGEQITTPRSRRPAGPSRSTAGDNTPTDAGIAPAATAQCNGDVKARIEEIKARRRTVENNE